MSGHDRPNIIKKLPEGEGEDIEFKESLGGS